MPMITELKENLIEKWDTAQSYAAQLFPTHNKRGMFDQLVPFAISLAVFTMVVVTAIVINSKFGNTVGGDANTTAVYMNTQLGSSGLAGYTGTIIVIFLGVLFIGAIGGLLYFSGKKY